MTINSNPCTLCASTFHTKAFCPQKPRTALKRTPIKTPLNQIRKPIKKKAVSRSKLKKKLELLVKQAVKERDAFTCQRCGKVVEGSNCHASHVLPVGSHANMQFDLLNMKVLCFHDHINWWHKNPLESGQWFRDNYPDRWMYLEARDKLRIKITTVELQEMIDSYKSHA